MLDARRLSSAKTSFEDSWELLTEILALIRPSVLYIIIDSIDAIHPEYTNNPASDFGTLF